MSFNDILNVALLIVPTAGTALVWLIRLEMRVRFLASQQTECRRERIGKEDNLLNTVQQSAVDIASVRADVRMIRDLLLNGINPKDVPR